ncbi:MAG: T9SS type A sorting domain-containing protein [Chitinophagaceae bacterium]|nr:T9SS type A sorting domain-containing protein [Chitinophagaceae bacterium]
MKKFYSVALLFFILIKVNSQTPINLSAQPNFTYTESFSDIANWTFSTTPQNGTFISGNGASAWRGLEPGGTTSIPDANKITTNSTFFQIPPSGSGGYSSGVYKGNEQIQLLSTGTADNTSSVAMDFYLNFSGINANTLSFDWAVLNNSTGNRNGSLKVFASTDGINFTEIIAARVNNFTNNSPTTVAGSITNISLPSILNNSASARLRFYYHNGTGGTSGSRPRLSLDNIKVTAVPTNPCTTPSAQATNFNPTSILSTAVQFSFNHASPLPNNYLVVMSNNSALSSLPINGTTYNLGDNLGDGNVIEITNNNAISVSNLTPATTYYFFIFAMNNSCTGGPLYYTTNALQGSITTLSGNTPCASPSAQATQLQFSNITLTSITGNYTAAFGTDEYLIIRTTSSNFTGTINNGTLYSGGQVLGNGSVVTRTAGTSFIANNLNSGTKYYFFVFGLNRFNCNNGPAYLISSPLNDSATTIAQPVCTTPTQQPTNLSLSSSNNYVNGYFTAASSADGYLVVRTTTSTLTSNPVNGTIYAAGSALGNGIVISSNGATAFVDVNLNAATTYYYFVFARNGNCTGGIKYLTTTPLSGNIATTAIATTNIYYGNLHAHSRYSDGNQDNPSFTPANDYAYAKNSLCLDFLGISEHNHASAGMSISNWPLGINQATAATTSNFLALYGMEWGVISNGGHVLVYGTNQLIGWETNNYNVFVPKSNYLGTPETNGTIGLFRTLNSLGGNAFATLAHPSQSDFENLANIPYNASADSAILGCALANGPSTSTNTSYSDPASSYSYIDYYQRLLAKGYHIAPSIDHDNHNTTFGRTTYSRLAVVAPSISSNDFYTAMKSRSFYATEDCDTKIHFTLNNQIMGSILTGDQAPSISVYAIDPSNLTIPNIKLMYGVPGSNVIAIEIASTNGNVLNFTDFSLNNGSTGYYYVDVTIAGNRSISAPIWYTKTGVVPVQFVKFTAHINNHTTVNLQWQTVNEINADQFIVERSFDGVHFTAIDSIKAFNQNSNSYFIIDPQPLSGINYYRLKQQDNDGRFSYSTVISININQINVNAFSVFPNPVKDKLSLNIFSNQNESSIITISDIFGRVLQSKKQDLIKGKQIQQVDMSQFPRGNYQVTVSWQQAKVTQKILKLF